MPLFWCYYCLIALLFLMLHSTNDQIKETILRYDHIFTSSCDFVEHCNKTIYGSDALNLNLTGDAKFQI